MIHRPRHFARILRETYRPRQVSAISAYPVAPGGPALLKDRPLLDGLPTAYVCQGFACLQPTNEPGRFVDQLAGKSLS